MQFHDVLLVGGRIASRHQHETNMLAQPAIHAARKALRQLRRGALVSDPVVDVGFSLGLPADLFSLLDADGQRRARQVGRYFCCHDETREPPVLINAILLGDESPTRYTSPEIREGEVHADAWTLSTLIGISAVWGAMARDEAIEALYEEIMQRRPCLVGAYHPVGWAEVVGEGREQALRVIPDAATCFAAAMLLDHTEAR